MIRFCVGDVRDKPTEILITEGLEGLVYGFAVDLAELFVGPLKGSFHNGGDNDPFPVGDVKPGDGLVSFI
jgi:hypothetical protein